MEKTVDFSICGLNYRIYMNDTTGSVAFELRSGATKKGKKRNHFFWYNDEDEIGDVDLTANPFGVLNKVKDAVISWMYESKPKMIYFEASTKRKAAVYRRYINRSLKEIEKLYHFYEHENGHFSFYLKKT